MISSIPLRSACTVWGARESLVSDSSKAGNFAPKAFAKRPDAQGYIARDFEAAMAALFATRKIKLAVYGRAGDARQRIVRDGDEQSHTRCVKH